MLNFLATISVKGIEVQVKCKGESVYFAAMDLLDNLNPVVNDLKILNLTRVNND